MPVARRPQQAGTGLNFEPGEIVVLELRAERHVEPVCHQHDLILREGAHQVHRAAGRGERDGEGVAFIVAGQSVAQAPHDIMATTNGEAMLEIKVDIVPVFFEDGCAAHSSIVVDLEAHVRSAGERVRPPPQQIPPRVAK